MRDYQRWFQPQIWSRGYDYYRKNRVHINSREYEHVYATVDGTDLYEVSIYFYNGEIQDMECDCPYAMDGNNCKHMAAVLIKLSEEETSLSNTAPQKVEIRSDNVWKNIIYKYFKGNAQRYINQGSAFRFDKEFSMILASSTNEDMMYEKWDNLFVTLHEMLDVSNSISASIPMPTTIQTLQSIFERLKASPSSGSFQSLHWIQQHLKTTKRLDFLTVLLENGYTKDQVGVHTLEKECDEYHRQKNFHASSYCLKLKIQLMEDLKYNVQDILSSIMKYKNYGIVKDYEIKCDIQSGRYTIAKDKLLAYLQIPTLDHHKQTEILVNLMQVSLMLKEYDNYLKQLTDLYKNSSILPTKYVKDLLNFAKTKNEYEMALNSIYKIIKVEYSSQHFIEILFELELYEKALYEVYHTQEINLLMYHEDILKEYDTQLYYYVFYFMMITAMQNATTQEQFYRLYHNLLEFAKSKEDEVVIDEISIYAKEHFSGKKFLIELLNELY